MSHTGKREDQIHSRKKCAWLKSKTRLLKSKLNLGPRELQRKEETLGGTACGTLSLQMKQD